MAKLVFHDAWAWEGRVATADGQVWAEVTDASEIGMGSPSMGTLKTSSGFVCEGCSPSMALREDGKYLAFIEWQDRSHVLKVLRLRDNAVIAQSGPYAVLALQSFRGNEVDFIDRPATNARVLTFSVDAIPPESNS